MQKCYSKEARKQQVRLLTNRRSSFKSSTLLTTLLCRYKKRNLRKRLDNNLINLPHMLCFPVGQAKVQKYNYCFSEMYPQHHPEWLKALQ